MTFAAECPCQSDADPIGRTSRFLEMEARVISVNHHDCLRFLLRIRRTSAATSGDGPPIAASRHESAAWDTGTNKACGQPGQQPETCRSHGARNDPGAGPSRAKSLFALARLERRGIEQDSAEQQPRDNQSPEDVHCLREQERDCGAALFHRDEIPKSRLQADAYESQGEPPRP